MLCKKRDFLSFKRTEKTPRIPTAEAEGSRGKKGTGLALKGEAAT